MNSKHRNFWLLTFVSVLVASSLACNLFSHRLIVPKPTETVPVTTEAAQDLENNLQSGLDNFQSNGELTFSITEAQFDLIDCTEAKRTAGCPDQGPPGLFERRQNPVLCNRRPGQYQHAFGSHYRSGCRRSRDAHLPVPVGKSLDRFLYPIL